MTTALVSQRRPPRLLFATAVFGLQAVVVLAITTVLALRTFVFAGPDMVGEQRALTQLAIVLVGIPLSVVAVLSIVGIVLVWTARRGGRVLATVTGAFLALLIALALGDWVVAPWGITAMTLWLAGGIGATVSLWRTPHARTDRGDGRV